MSLPQLVIGLFIAFAAFESQATTIYSTTFPTPPYIQNQPWAGIDGWLGNNTGNAQDDVILDVGSGNLGGLLGLDNTNQSNVLSVFQETPYDPVAQGEPIVILTMRLGFQQSTNGNHDVFSIALFNQNIEILGELIFQPETGSVLYFDGTQTTDTGLNFPGSGFLNLRVTIDFVQNLWSASIDGVRLFSDVNFSDPGQMLDLNLGSLDLRWSPTDPMNSGDNYMVVDDIDLSANTRFTASDRAPLVSTKKKIKTSKGRIKIKGSAEDDTGVSRVEYKAGKGGFKTAKGTSNWNFRAKLKPGKNKFLVRAIDAAGQVSSIKKVTVIRK